MKKTLIALAALAATSAFAQVTVYGRMDVGYANTKTTITETGVDDVTIKANGVQSHNSASSMWGIQGSEDLGGGLKAMFKLEQDVYVANGNTGNSGSGGGASGSAAFNRTSIVGLTGAFGTVAFGRDYVPTFKLASATDIMGQSRLTTVNASGVLGSTSPNLVFYSSPNMSGFQLNVAIGNQDDTNSGATGDTTTKTTNLSATYANGPLFVGFGTGSSEVRSAGASTGTVALAGVEVIATGIDKTTMNILGASYNFGTFKLVGNIINGKYNIVGGDDLKTQEVNIGATMPMGKVTLGAQVGTNSVEYTGDPELDGTDLVLSAEYALSAKTALFAKTGTVNKFSDADFSVKQTSTAVGIRTVF